MVLADDGGKMFIDVKDKIDQAFYYFQGVIVFAKNRYLVVKVGVGCKGWKGWNELERL